MTGFLLSKKKKAKPSPSKSELLTHQHTFILGFAHHSQSLSCSLYPSALIYQRPGSDALHSATNRPQIQNELLAVRIPDQAPPQGCPRHLPPPVLFPQASAGAKCSFSPCGWDLGPRHGGCFPLIFWCSETIAFHKETPFDLPWAWSSELMVCVNVCAPLERVLSRFNKQEKGGN